MGDMGEVFNAMRGERQERHSRWHEQNTTTIDASGVPYRRASRECYVFQDGPLQADFYPSTGRWRCRGKTRSGGAKEFLVWWKAVTDGTGAA